MITRIQRWLYPELRHVNGFKPMQDLIWRTSTRSMQIRRVWISFVFCIAAIVGMVPLLYAIDLDWVVEYPYFFHLVAVFSILIFGWIQRGSMRREMRAELRFAGLPICINCGYDLTTIENNLCPECGFDNYSSIDEKSRYP